MKRLRTFESLRVHNFRLFWGASLLANTAGWMNVIAQDWLVLTVLTENSAAALGIVTGLQFLPAPLFMPVAGALADRFPKRRVLQVTQSLLVTSALLLALSVSLGIVQLWHVYVLALLNGTIQAFDSPARMSFVAEMVPEKLLPNAVGLNSMQFNSARLLGPAVSGLLIGWIGIAPVLGINVLAALFPLIALTLLRTEELLSPKNSPGKSTVREGLAYVRNRPDLLMIFFAVFMLGTFGLNFQLTNALMATQVFGLGAGEFGLLGSMMAAGTLSGSVMAARRGYPMLGLMVSALGGFALASLALTMAPWYWLYAAMLIPTGFLAITVLTTANSRVQLTTKPELRGRVMALYMAVLLGGTPLGAPTVGWIGELWGARATVLVGAGVTGATAVIIGIFLLITAEHYPAPLHFLESVRTRVRVRRRKLS